MSRGPAIRPCSRGLFGYPNYMCSRNGHGCTDIVLDSATIAESMPRTYKTWHVLFEAGQPLALAAISSAEEFVFVAGNFGMV